MPGPVLYSTNAWVKFHIQCAYRKQRHFVWCSEAFDSSKLGAYVTSARVPSSSDPATIYKELHAAVTTEDEHCAWITKQRNSLAKLAKRWNDAGEITDGEKTEILYLLKKATFKQWRPLIYVIPRAAVEAKLELVPRHKRAGNGNEYWLKEPDLGTSDFDVIELG